MPVSFSLFFVCSFRCYFPFLSASVRSSHLSSCLSKLIACVMSYLPLCLFRCPTLLLSIYIPSPFLPFPVFLIAKSMLKVRELWHGMWAQLPTTSSSKKRVCVCASLLAPHTSSHPSICPISTCAEAQPPGKLTNESLPQPSVVLLPAFYSFNFFLSSISPFLSLFLSRRAKHPPPPP